MDTANEPSDKRKKRAWETIKKECEANDYEPEWWWQATVWATGATAIHNVAQMDPVERLRTAHPGPLSIREDPLAYLGILVDVLQEWDRHTVAGLSPVTGIRPLQGIDVSVEIPKDLIHLVYDTAHRAGKVKKTLDMALQDWKNLVDISP